MRWERDGHHWPHHRSSLFVRAGGLRWHVQRMGQGPVLLLIHGTGASTHSWRGLMPLLAHRFSVVAMDLPGHAYTETPPLPALSLPGMARAVAALVGALELEPAWIVGHSAGAAIGARMLLDGSVRAAGLAGINAAMFPMGGLPGLLFPPVAKLMAATPLAPRLFAGRNWSPAAVERLLAGTGSALDAHGIALYGALLRDAAHAAGALGMMARWDLPPLARDLARLKTPLALVVGANDKAVPPGDAQRVRGLLPVDTPCTIDTVDGCGHLVHEEQPELVARLLFDAMARTVRPTTVAEPL